MAKKRIFYSIDVECENKDTMNFMELLHPGEDFHYEYVEDITEPKIDYIEAFHKMFAPETQK